MMLINLMNENGDFVIIFRSCFENKKKTKASSNGRKANRKRRKL